MPQDLYGSKHKFKEQTSLSTHNIPILHPPTTLLSGNCNLMTIPCTNKMTQSNLKQSWATQQDGMDNSEKMMQWETMCAIHRKTASRIAGESPLLTTMLHCSPTMARLQTYVWMAQSVKPMPSTDSLIESMTTRTPVFSQARGITRKGPIGYYC